MFNVWICSGEKRKKDNCREWGKCKNACVTININDLGSMKKYNVSSKRICIKNEFQ